MSATTSAMGSFYDEKRAVSELRKYRERGPIPSTRALIDALKTEGVEGATLLDIGGGIGAIQHELLAAGAAHATSVDASASYLDAARAESERRGLDGRVTYLHGDSRRSHPLRGGARLGRMGRIPDCPLGRSPVSFERIGEKGGIGDRENPNARRLLAG
jgi:hypothetical protein